MTSGPASLALPRDRTYGERFDAISAFWSGVRVRRTARKGKGTSRIGLDRTGSHHDERVFARLVPHPGHTESPGCCSCCQASSCFEWPRGGSVAEVRGRCWGASYKCQILAGGSSPLQPSSRSIQLVVLRLFEGWLRRRWWLGEWLLYRWPIRLMFSGFNQAVTCVPGVGCGDG